MTHIYELALSCFCFPDGYYICAILWHGISTKSWDSYGHKLCFTKSGFIFILLWKGFMPHLHKPKRYDIIDMFNGTSQYLDDIFTIDNLRRTWENIFLIHISNRKQIDVHPSSYDKSNDFCPNVNFLPLSGDVPRLQKYGIFYILKLVTFVSYSRFELPF